MNALNAVKKPITLTPAAVEHVQRQLTVRGRGLGIRVRLKKTGCAGFEYVLEFVDHEEAQDQVFPITDGHSVYVDPKTYQYVKGMIIDYGKEHLNEGLIFKNPNVSDECGCGKSVRFDEVGDEEQ